MSFLQEYDSISTNDPSAQAAFVIKWLRGNPTAMFDELRADRPIFINPVFTMVVRATDVLDILSQHQLFSVRLNAKSMDPAVGPFMLARDETELNWHEKSIMRAVLRHDDLPRLKAFVGSIVTSELSTSEGGLDVVARISRLVPLRIVQSFFGFAAPDELMLKWSFATQHASSQSPGEIRW